MGKTKKNQESELQTNLRANIESKQRKLGFSDDQMARSMAINTQTYRRKVMARQQFTYLELIKIFTILQFTDSEILESI